MPLDTAIIVAVLSDTVAALVGPKWEMTRPEQTGGKQVLDALLTKYGASIADFGPEIAAAIWVTGYTLPRLLAARYAESDNRAQGDRQDDAAEASA